MPEKIDHSGKSVLLLADANRRAVITAARVLSGNGNIKKLIFAIEKSFPMKMTSVLLKKYTDKILIYDKDDILGFLSFVRKEYGAFYILPVGETLIRKFLKDTVFLREQQIEFCIKDLAGYTLLSNKESFKNLCIENGLPVPGEYKRIPDTAEKKFVVKPRLLDESNDSLLDAPLLVENEEGLLRLKKLNIDTQLHFIQEYIEGPSVYYNAFYREGEKVNCFSQINIVQQPNGKSVIKAAPYKIPDNITNKIDGLFKGLKWSGPIMFELKYSKTQDRYFGIECNPRLWGPVQLSADNGVDFISPAVDEEPIKTENVKQTGYIWLNGYLSSYLMSKQLKQNPQVYKDMVKQKIRYKDVYLRKDTYRYFFVEMGYWIKEILAANLKK